MKKYQYIVCGLLLAVQSVQSQDFGFDDDVQDVPAAPIDDWVLPVMLLAVGLAFYAFKKSKAKQHL